eukprot:scaffold62486_cov66-Phaeocystis_antarctica.AAC.1
MTAPLCWPPLPGTTACPSRPALLSLHWPRPARHHFVAPIPRARSPLPVQATVPGGIIPKASATSPHPHVLHC